MPSTSVSSNLIKNKDEAAEVRHHLSQSISTEVNILEWEYRELSLMTTGTNSGEDPCELIKMIHI